MVEDVREMNQKEAREKSSVSERRAGQEREER